LAQMRATRPLSTEDTEATVLSEDLDSLLDDGAEPILSEDQQALMWLLGSGGLPQTGAPDPEAGGRLEVEIAYFPNSNRLLQHRPQLYKEKKRERRRRRELASQGVIRRTLDDVIRPSG
jgi:hypothetical protein